MKSHEPTMTQNPRGTRSWGRFAGIVAVYLLLGPFLGALSTNLSFIIYSIGVEIAAGQFGDISRLLWGGLVMGTIVLGIGAYAFGSVSALAVGLVIAQRDRKQGAINMKTAVNAALVVWVLMSLAATSVVPRDGLAQWIGALFVAHLVAAVVCTWIARRIFR